MNDYKREYLLSYFLLFLGTTIVFTSHKLPDIFGIFLFIIGIFLVNFYGTKFNHNKIQSQINVEFSKSFFKSKFENNNLIIGLSLITTVFLLERISENQGLGDYSMMVLFLSALVLVYNTIPEEYTREKDFLTIFLALLVVGLVIPNFLFATLDLVLGKEPTGLTSSTTFVSIFLAKPLSISLNAFGYETQALDEWLLYRTPDSPIVQRVGIAHSCSGLYSVIIFICGFTTYVILERHLFTSFSIAIIILAGVFTSYLANLFRMVMIIAIGIHYGNDEMYWAHRNLGWLIFLLWMTIFWSIIFKIYDTKREAV